MTSVDSPAYRVSALATALVRMWRAWAVIVVVSVVNAAIQVLLVLAGADDARTPLVWALATLSLLAMVLSFGLVCRALLDSLDSRGRVTLSQALIRATGRRFPALVGWSLALVGLATLGLLVYVVPGLVVLALFPYLLIAVVDGRARPVAVNFRTIAARWGRWLVTVVVVGAIAFAIWLAAALDTFFLRTAPGLFVGWILIGIIASWTTCAWALIYRAVNPATSPDPAT